MKIVAQVCDICGTNREDSIRFMADNRQVADIDLCGACKSTLSYLLKSPAGKMRVLRLRKEYIPSAKTFEHDLSTMETPS